MKNIVEDLNLQVEGKSAEEVLMFILGKFPGKVTFGTSLGSEDQVILDMMSRCCSNFSIFTLDTGRLFPETYDLIDKTNKKYNLSIKVHFPDNEQVEEMVNSKGINLFLDSIENRKQCCYLRKIEPLKKALPGNDIWITGLRKDQSLNRFNTKLIEWDDKFEMVKVNPLMKWTEKDVWAYIKKNNVPYNVLHDNGFPSIGCQPCTRAVEKGEDSRAGRWWWEAPEHNECGLHSRK